MTENTKKDSESVEYKATLGEMAEANEFKAFLPPEHTGRISTAMVVAFAFTTTRADDGSLNLHQHPMAPSIKCCGYSESLAPEETLHSIIQAPPGGLVYVFRIKGPDGMRHNSDLGVHFSGTTPVDFQARAITACEKYSEAFEHLACGNLGMDPDSLAADLLQAIKGMAGDPRLNAAIKKAMQRNGHVIHYKAQSTKSQADDNPDQ